VFVGKSATNRTLPKLPSSVLTVDSNIFGTAPSDDACRGTNAQRAATGRR